MSEGESRGEAGNQQGAKIREADIAAFADKLEEWGTSLPVMERALLYLVLARAEGSIQELRGTEDLTLPGVMETTMSVLRPYSNAMLEEWIRIKGDE